MFTLRRFRHSVRAAPFASRCGYLRLIRRDRRRVGSRYGIYIRIPYCNATPNMRDADGRRGRGPSCSAAAWRRHTHAGGSALAFGWLSSNAVTGMFPARRRAGPRTRRRLGRGARPGADPTAARPDRTRAETVCGESVTPGRRIGSWRFPWWRATRPFYRPSWSFASDGWCQDFTRHSSSHPRALTGC